MPKTLLVIDDSSTIQEAVQHALTGEDWEVISATTPEDASNALQEQKFDAILSDVAVGDTDGYELCRTIGSSPEGAGIPVLLMGATVNATAALAVGASGTLPKPFESEQLVKTLSETLDQGDFSLDFDDVAAPLDREPELDMEPMSEELGLTPAAAAPDDDDLEEVEIIDLSGDEEYSELELLDDLQPIEPVSVAPAATGGPEPELESRAGGEDLERIGDFEQELDLGDGGEGEPLDLAGLDLSVAAQGSTDPGELEFDSTLDEAPQAELEQVLEPLAEDPEETSPDFPQRSSTEPLEGPGRATEAVAEGTVGEEGFDLESRLDEALAEEDAVGVAAEEDVVPEIGIVGEPGAAETLSETEWSAVEPEVDIQEAQDLERVGALEPAREEATDTAPAPETPPQEVDAAWAEPEPVSYESGSWDQNLEEAPLAEPGPDTTESEPAAAQGFQAEALATSVAEKAGQAVRDSLQASLSADNLAPIIEAAVERVAWEVVPQLAERLIRETIERLQEQPPNG